MAAMQTQGTVLPAQSFSAENAAAVLRKAMKGLGTDEAAIIGVMSSHSNEQRQQIMQSFKTQFGKDLRAELKSELSGKFENLVLALLELPRDFDAKEIHDAISGAGTNEATLIEILCSRSNAEIQQIKDRYKFWFKKDLEKDVMSDTSGHFKRLLVSQLAANRQEGQAVDQALAAQDADDLHKASNKIGTDESEFNRILCLRSHPQLCAMFDNYRIRHNKEIESIIKGETSGSLQDGYLALVKVAKCPAAYFAERLHKSMCGAGTNDRALIRVVVSRSEIDMVQIKQEFHKAYKGQTLGSFIKGDTSGDYKKLLLALCAEQ